MEDNEYSSPSFYVADDEKSIAIVDLLECMKSIETTVQFYLNLLKDLSEMMDEVGVSVETCVLSTPYTDNKTLAMTEEGIPTEQSEYKQTLDNLLDMEYELEESMRRIRKRLMVIRLIGLMSEDDKLKNELVKNAGKMIEVINLFYSFVNKL